jgi:hypothetical protein
MASNDAREVVGALLKNTWSNVENIPIAWPNREFAPPGKAPWVRVTIIEGSGEQVTIGGTNNLYRHSGILFLQVFVPVNSGDYKARSIADELADVFRSDSFDGAAAEVVRFRTPRIRPIGAEGAYYQVNCEVPFLRDMIA